MRAKVVAVRQTIRMQTPRPRHRRAIGLFLVAASALLIGCGASPAAAPSSPGTPVPGDVIELQLTGDLKIEQAGQQVATITVRKGQTYTFRITNTAGFEHDFHIGTDEALRNGTPGLPGVDPFSSGTKEFSYTFDTDGPLAFGCTIPGHYSAMKGTFAIVP
jgi:uncharacterized cupredoxin-like copper-binding protein